MRRDVTASVKEKLMVEKKTGDHLRKLRLTLKEMRSDIGISESAMASLTKAGLKSSLRDYDT